MIGAGLRNRPKVLERAYQAAEAFFDLLAPAIRRFGFARTERLILWPEEVSKKALFDCRMCGQCILHSTGMTCPMTCPKTLRNGPCGGVRQNGNCEVKPEMRCVWVEAYERSLKMTFYGDEMQLIQPPVNRQLEGTSAWINQLTGVDRSLPPGWEANDRAAA